MSPRLWDDDDELLHELAEALRSPGEITEEMLAAGRAAYTWRTIDEELALASLVYDSALDLQPLLRAGPLSAPRTVVFESNELTVEIELTRDGVVGQLMPPQPGEVVVMTDEGPFDHASADELGCFTLRLPPAGPARLRCRTDGASLVTDWVRL